MCSPSDIDKLLKDDNLFKQYVIQKLSDLNDTNNTVCSQDKDIQKITDDITDIKLQLEKLKTEIDNINNNLSLFRKVIIGAITAIGGLFGYQFIF